MHFVCPVSSTKILTFHYYFWLWDIAWVMWHMSWPHSLLAFLQYFGVCSLSKCTFTGFCCCRVVVQSQQFHQKSMRWYHHNDSPRMWKWKLKQNLNDFIWHFNSHSFYKVNAFFVVRCFHSWVAMIAFVYWKSSSSYLIYIICGHQVTYINMANIQDNSLQKDFLLQVFKTNFYKQSHQCFLLVLDDCRNVSVLLNSST